MKSAALSIALAMSLGVLVWAVLRPDSEDSGTSAPLSQASRQARGPEHPGRLQTSHRLSIDGDAPEAAARPLVAGSESARAAGIAFSNFLPEDWEPRLAEEVRDAWEDFTRQRQAGLHPNAERMLRESGHDTLIVEETGSGPRPMALEKPEEGRR